MRRESDLQDDCLKYLEGRVIYCINTHGDAWERRGRPDIYICHRGRFIGCELKRGAGSRPTALQLKHLREIRKNGGIGVWITTLDELKNLINSLDP